MSNAAVNSGMARGFLGANAVFSLACGLGLAVFAPAFAAAAFVDAAAWTTALRWLGIGLVVFAADLWLMRGDRFIGKVPVRLVAAADVLWIAGSAAGLVWFADRLTAVGQGAVVAIASIVGVFAVGQLLGAQRITAPQSVVSARRDGDVLRLNVTRRVDAAPDVVWRVMTDHPGYADVASNIAKVEVLDGDGLGMRRRCSDPKGGTWTETCDVFEAGRRYGFVVDTDAADYPYPIAALQGRWSVAPDGAGAVFAIDIAARPKGNGLQRWLFHRLAARQFKPVLIDLADAWAARMEGAALTGQD